MKTNPNDSVNAWDEEIYKGDMVFSKIQHQGLTKREYFASRAPEFVLNESVTVGDMKKFFGVENYHLIKDYDFKFKASRAVAWADALIKALNEEGE